MPTISWYQFLETMCDCGTYHTCPKPDLMFKTCDGTAFGPTTYPRYRLKKDIPGLRAGAVFELGRMKNDRGLAVLLLEKGCQGWHDSTFMLPGFLAGDPDWFEKIPETNYLKESLLERIEALKKLVEKEFK